MDSQSALNEMNDTTWLTPPAGTDPAYLERVEHITGRSWPLLVDGPGEYRTRNGLRAVVSAHARNTPSAFICEGHVILREKPRRETWTTWKPNGQLQAIGEHPLDLVAKLSSASQA